MTNIIVALPRLEDAKSVRNILVRSGFPVTGVCTTGAQAISQADELDSGILICGYKLTDMVYSELHHYLPPDFEMLLIASPRFLSQCEENGIVCLSMPLKIGELVSTVGMIAEGLMKRRRKARQTPRVRKPEEETAIREAKELLMNRNHMTEEEAHRYLQKCSMDNSINLAETAFMILSVMKS